MQAEEFLAHALLRNQLMGAQTAGSIANMFFRSRQEEADRPKRISA